MKRLEEMYNAPKTLLYFVLLSSISCADKASPTAAPVNGLVGQWQGLSKLKLDNQESLQDIRLELDSNGKFLMTELVSQRRGEGRYELFERLGSITLRFDESSLEDPAAEGAILDLEYELYENELSLVGQNIVIKLKRQQSLDSDASVEGAWNCLTSEDGSRWELQLGASSLLMYASLSGGSTLFVKASMTDVGRSVLDRDQLEELYGPSYLYTVEQGMPIKPFDALMIFTGVSEKDDPSDATTSDDTFESSEKLYWMALRLNQDASAYQSVEPGFTCRKPS